MQHNIELDRILARLAKPLSRLSDTLLDLRQWALNPSQAGSCVEAYFALVAEAPATEEVANHLGALRNWLELRLNILVFDGERAVCLETLPVALAGATDLKGFCIGAMQRMRNDRCHPFSHLRLEFSFSAQTATAA